MSLDLYVFTIYMVSDLYDLCSLWYVIYIIEASIKAIIEAIMEAGAQVFGSSKDSKFDC